MKYVVTVTQKNERGYGNEIYAKFDDVTKALEFIDTIMSNCENASCKLEKECEE